MNRVPDEGRPSAESDGALVVDSRAVGGGVTLGTLGLGLGLGVAVGVGECPGACGGGFMCVVSFALVKKWCVSRGRRCSCSSVDSGGEKQKKRRGGGRRRRRRRRTGPGPRRSGDRRQAAGEAALWFYRGRRAIIFDAHDFCLGVCVLRLLVSLFLFSLLLPYPPPPPSNYYTSFFSFFLSLFLKQAV